MQRMTKEKLQGYNNEFDLTCAAQDGNGEAWLILWNQYKDMMMSRLIKAKGFTREELESEALEVFSYELLKFDRNKVTTEAAFSMFIWLYCRAKNRTAKLIRQRKKEVHLYMEDVNANTPTGDSIKVITLSQDDAEDLATLQNQAIGKNEDLYSTYSPEKLVVQSLKETDSARVKAFYARLSQLQKDILIARREGLTLTEVAERFHCSVTTIKNQLKKAKNHAEMIFDVAYA